MVNRDIQSSFTTTSSVLAMSRFCKLRTCHVQKPTTAGFKAVAPPKKGDVRCQYYGTPKSKPGHLGDNKPDLCPKNWPIVFMWNLGRFSYETMQEHQQSQPMTGRTSDMFRFNDSNHILLIYQLTPEIRQHQKSNLGFLDLHYHHGEKKKVQSVTTNAALPAFWINSYMAGSDPSNFLQRWTFMGFSNSSDRARTWWDLGAIYTQEILIFYPLVN